MLHVQLAKGRSNWDTSPTRMVDLPYSFAIMVYVCLCLDSNIMAYLCVCLGSGPPRKHVVHLNPQPIMRFMVVNRNTS